MLDSERFNPHHAPAGSSEGGQFTSGNGGANAGKDKGAGKLAEVGQVPQGGADLRWKSEDTIKGSLVIEVPDDMDVSSIDDSDIKDFVKAQLPGKVGSIDSGDDIESISITKKQTGKGYIKVDLDITPTTEAGEHWLDTGDAAGQWSTYHGGRSTNATQDILERVKEFAMPYTGPDDEKLPENVKKLDKGKRAQWVEVWNSAHKKCLDDGGDAKTCETSAFKQANGVVGKGNKTNAIVELWESVKRLFAPLVEDEERTIKDAASWDGSASNYSDTEAYCKACLINMNDGDPANWTQDNCKLPVKDSGGSYVKQGIHAAAVALAGGRTPIKAPPDEKKKAADKLISLYNQMDEQAPDSIYKIAGKEPPKRMMAYLPTQTHALTITRDAQGNPRWLMIAASAVVNKVGAIDSTVLFDNFIRYAAETNEYPVLDFFHEGERVRFGVADWLKRDGALYLASGPFDDTDLARGAANGLETQAGYWGGSIAYRVTAAPLMLISEGEIPVYTDGVNNFISIVPKRLAANLFTATLVAEEVHRMNATAYEELVKLVGEERAKQFADQVDDANRTITETGMITRADETPPAAPVAEAMPKATWVPVEEHRDASPESPKTDDLAALKAAVADLAAKVAKLEESYGMGMEESKRTQERATSEVNALGERLAAVEASKERWDTWLNDAPEYVKVEADKIYRARDQESAPVTLAQIAEQSLSKLHRGPHEQRGK